ncbi:response regulator protein VraR [Duganella sp. HH105]|nr:response regulator protein VraR [Duganella sp. HH105]OFA01040.1 response regulator protein VraR [Duganella sp. HH101]
MDGFFNSQKMDQINDFVDACHAVSSKKDFRSDVYPRLQNIIPHEMFDCGMIRMADLRVHESMNFTFPLGYMQSLLGEERSSSCPAIRKWTEKRQPVLVDRKSSWLLPNDNGWLEKTAQYDIRNVAVHGVADIDHENACYFALAGIDSWTKEDVSLLKFVVPHLHCALSHAIDFGNKRPTGSLTKREQQVLQWVCSGKSNTEIASILDISSWTVKIHVGNLLSKLNASNRSHAVAKAFSFNLVKN